MSFIIAIKKPCYQYTVVKFIKDIYIIYNTQKYKKTT